MQGSGCPQGLPEPGWPATLILTSPSSILRENLRFWGGEHGSQWVWPCKESLWAQVAGQVPRWQAGGPAEDLVLGLVSLWSHLATCRLPSPFHPALFLRPTEALVLNPHPLRPFAPPHGVGLPTDPSLWGFPETGVPSPHCDVPSHSLCSRHCLFAT